HLFRARRADRGGGPPELLDDLPLVIDHPSSDLGAPDINPDRQAHAAVLPRAPPIRAPPPPGPGPSPPPIPRRTALCRTAPSRTALCRTAPSRTALCRTAPSRTALCRTAPSRTALCRTAPSRTAPRRVPRPPWPPPGRWRPEPTRRRTARRGRAPS